MRIWHDGLAVSAGELNGVNAAIWLLAREQARLGHDVTLLVTEKPDPKISKRAADSGFRLADLPASIWRYQPAALAALLDAHKPTLVHMHSAFVPRQSTLADELRRREIPYVVSPHGGFSTTILRRRPLAKMIYRRLFEMRRCVGAAAVAASPGEAAEVRNFLAGRGTIAERMPVPVELSTFAGQGWRGNLAAKRIVFLGRFDVHIKGLDRLIDLAGLMRDFRFDLYGAVDPKTKEQLGQLQNNIVPNVFFHAPVFGADKVRTLCDASAYVQLSRSESFGISIAEAMSLGVPCAIADEIHMADAFRRENLGLTLPPVMGEAARMLTDSMANPTAMLNWSRRARDYARVTFDPARAAGRYIELYEDLLGVPPTPIRVPGELTPRLFPKKLKAYAWSKAG